MEPTQQKKTEQIDKLAGNATRACFARFRSCIAALDGEHRNHLEVRFTDLKLWADSVGALAEGKASLDWRLSGRSSDIFLVTSLLDMLERFLEGYTTATIEDGDEDEIEEAKQGIDEMTDNLAWIGSAIRRSGTKSRLQKADMSFERDRAGEDKWQCDQLRAHLICVMKSRPTEPAKSKDYSQDFHSMELQGIQNRLVEANLRRWHRFRYAQRHSDILRASRAVQNMPLNVIPEGSAPNSAAEPRNTPAPRMNVAAAKQRNEANDQDETRTTAGLSASAFGSEYQGLEGRYARPAKSTMTRISTITGFARFPKAKKSQTQRKTLMCPCCCQALPLEEAEDPDLWAKHMKNDISPYTCIVENCPTPYRLYVTRNEWREHVLCDHPPKWRCSCCTGTRPVFQSLPAFMAHLDEEHESQVSDETFESVMTNSTFRTFGITNCPLCNDCGPTDSPELIEHVLEHMYGFSLYALPWRTTLQANLKKPIRTFNDVAPVFESGDDEDAIKMRMFSHARILKWVENPHLEEEKLTAEQKAMMRDLDSDNYQAMENEDGADPIVADYFDRTGIDYFDDNASSCRVSSRSSRSVSTSQLSMASGSGYSSPVQPISPMSAQETESALHEATISDNETISGDENISDEEIIGNKLYTAISKGDEKMVKLLLEKGANLESQDADGQTPLSWAAANGQKAVVELLLTKGANLESQDRYRQTPLSWAARNGYKAVVKLLLKKGANLESQDRHFNTPLCWAARNGHEAVVKLLLNKGSNLKSQDISRHTPLSWAARNGHEAVVKLLLEKGVGLESQDRDLDTPLYWAAKNGYEAVVELLLEKGANLDVQYEYGRTPLSWAARNGHKAVVKLLLEKTAYLEQQEDINGQTPLFWAAQYGHEAVVKLLLETGEVDVDSRDKDGETPLSLAAGKGHEAVVKLLIETGKVNVDSRDKNGDTPLSLAAKKGHKAIINLLQSQSKLS